MSDAFTHRERAMETGHRLDEELRFKATARRNKAFGLWAAGELGLEAAAADAYALALVEADLAPNGEDTLIARVLTDLTAKGVDMTEGRLRIKLERLLAEAEAAVRGA
ncbi:DUF1476 domain-containing protein [Pararhodospirillum photometricum]|nr:DUF1476 domain-containing protein [Pararhodospirillum photometricum]